MRWGCAWELGPHVRRGHVHFGAGAAAAVLLSDVYGSVRLGAWVQVPLPLYDVAVRCLWHRALWEAWVLVLLRVLLLLLLLPLPTNIFVLSGVYAGVISAQWLRGLKVLTD